MKRYVTLIIKYQFDQMALMYSYMLLICGNFEMSDSLAVSFASYWTLIRPSGGKFKGLSWIRWTKLYMLPNELESSSMRQREDRSDDERREDSDYLGVFHFRLWAVICTDSETLTDPLFTPTLTNSQTHKHRNREAPRAYESKCGEGKNLNWKVQASPNHMHVVNGSSTEN